MAWKKKIMFAQHWLCLLLACFFTLAQTGLPPKISPSREIIYRKNIGEDVKLRCRATGAHDDTNNRTLFVWKNQNGLIRQDRSRSPRYEVKQNKYLQISNIKAEDAGTYLCTAFNEFGSDAANRTLVVFDEDGKEVAPVKPSVERKPVRKGPMSPAFDFPNGEYVAPKITPRQQKPRKIHAVGSSTRLRCLINNANPPPEISWTKNGHSLQLGPRMKLKMGKKHLQFKSLRMKDNGNYTCIVSNRLGRDSYTFVVIVKNQIVESNPGKKDKHPNIVPSQVLKAVISGNFTLVCQSNAKRKRGIPRVKWLKYRKNKSTGESVMEEDFKAPIQQLVNSKKKAKKHPRTSWRFDSTKTGSIVASLTFTNVSYKDEGIYICTTGKSLVAVKRIMVKIVKRLEIAKPKDKAIGDRKRPFPAPDTNDQLIENEDNKKRGVPLFLLIAIPAVAGVICITFVFVCWRMHKKKVKMALRSRPEILKMTEQQQQPLRNGHVVKVTQNGSPSHNGSLSHNGTLCQNGSLSRNGTASQHGTPSRGGNISHNGSLNSLRSGVHRTQNGAAVTVVHHDPLLGTRLEYISHEGSLQSAT